MSSNFYNLWKDQNLD